MDKILTKELKLSLKKDLIPVIAPIGQNRKKQFLNINADVVAGEVAQALKAEKLILLTDVSGINDSKNNLISSISLGKGQKLLHEKLHSEGKLKMNTL